MKRFKIASILLVWTLLAAGCGDIFTESLDPKNNIPLTVLIPPPYYARGILDTFFGAEGVATAVATQESQDSFAHSIASYGRYLYIAGTIWNTEPGSEMAFWRYKADGSPDMEFGEDGCIRTVGSAMDGDPFFSDEGNAMTIAGDGTVYIAGGSSLKYETEHGFGGSDMPAVWKFVPSALNTGVKLFTVFNPYGTGDSSITGIAYGIQIDSKGRVLVTGFFNSVMIILCYNKYGFFDESFAWGGWILYYGLIGVGGLEIYDQACGFGLAIDSNGRILITGGVHIPESRNWFDNMSLWRLKPDGYPDLTFNNSGQVVHDGAARAGNPDGADIGRKVMIDQQDRILVLGSSADERNIDKAVIWCYKDNGELDPDFGNGGIVIVGDIPADPYKGEHGYDMALDSRGKIVVTGAYSSGMALWRFNPDGTPDETFGYKGVVLYPSTHETFNLTNGNSVTIRDGRIFVGGASGYDKSIMTIWRYK